MYPVYCPRKRSLMVDIIFHTLALIFSHQLLVHLKSFKFKSWLDSNKSSYNFTDGLVLVWFCTVRWQFAYTTSVDPEKKIGEPSLWVTGFSAETAGLPVIKLQRVGPRKTSCPDSVAIQFIKRACIDLPYVVRFAFFCVFCIVSFSWLFSPVFKFYRRKGKRTGPVTSYAPWRGDIGSVLRSTMGLGLNFYWATGSANAQKAEQVSIATRTSPADVVRA